MSAPAITPKTHSQQSTIQTIQKARKEGKKTSLVIGKMAHESLPKDGGYLWVSLDKDELKKEKKADKDRLHLTLNANKQEDLQKIKHLFDQVIVDRNVIKFLNNDPWRNLRTVLAPNKESRLITECHGSINRTYDSPVALADEKEALIVTMGRLSEEEQQKQIREGIDSFKGYLSRLFDSVVERKADTPYPGRTDGFKKAHFVLTGPKAEQSPKAEQAPKGQQRQLSAKHMEKLRSLFN